MVLETIKSYYLLVIFTPSNSAIGSDKLIDGSYEAISFYEETVSIKDKTKEL